MSKFEQISRSLDDKDNPNDLLGRMESFTIPKLKRELYELQSIEHPNFQSKLEELVDEAEEKFGVRVASEDICRKVLEEIAIESGGLSEGLNEAYLPIIVSVILEKTGEEGNVHEVIEEELTNVRDKGIYIDEVAVRDRASEMFYDPNRIDEKELEAEEYPDEKLV